MLEKNHTSKKEHDEIRECIAQHLEKALKTLQETSEKCAVHKIWYLAPGIPVHKIAEIIFQLDYIIDRTKPWVDESGDVKH